MINSMGTSRDKTGHVPLCPGTGKRDIRGHTPLGGVPLVPSRQARKFLSSYGLTAQVFQRATNARMAARSNGANAHCTKPKGTTT